MGYIGALGDLISIPWRTYNRHAFRETSPGTVQHSFVISRSIGTER